MRQSCTLGTSGQAGFSVALSLASFTFSTCPWVLPSPEIGRHSLHTTQHSVAMECLLYGII